MNNKNLIESAVYAALKYPFPVTADGFRRQLDALINFDTKIRSKNIKAKTLIMAGEQDALVTAEEVKFLSDALAFSKSLCFKTVAHSFHVENPELFISKISEFLLTNK